MYKDLVTIVIPVKEKPEIVSKFILGNLDVLSKCTVIVIDSGGGEELKGYASIYLIKNVSMTEARKIGYHFVDTPYILNLDSDTILPENFVEYSLRLLEDKNVAMVAIDYKEPQGHYAFGASLWKTNILKNLYNYIGFKENGYCECLHMFNRAKSAGYRLETLPLRAIHLGK
jgi:cellulose synthase/poly-beta-1,6-N-acetylglucosamine synthase-like glycosyltransferase